MPKPAAAKYRTKNWPEYNAALKRRGSLEIWFDPQIPQDEQILSVGGDGAYDTRACHAAIAERGADAVIPVRRNSRP